MIADTFDTLKFAQTLRDKAYVSQEQAESIAQAFADARGERRETRDERRETRDEQIATKTDLKETELYLETKIEASKMEILKWLFGTIGFQTFVIIASIVTLLKFVKP